VLFDPTETDKRNHGVREASPRDGRTTQGVIDSEKDIGKVFRHFGLLILAISMLVGPAPDTFAYDNGRKVVESKSMLAVS
jgi:hypothetical protein